MLFKVKQLVSGSSLAVMMFSRGGFGVASESPVSSPAPNR